MEYEKIGIVNKGFWGGLKLPIVGLSPMDGVTDAACRFISKKHGLADVIYTEFVSAEGLWRIKKRGETEHKIWKELRHSKSESPVVVQLFGSDPASFYEATMIVSSMGFDGIDINMGCPSPGLEKSGGGAGLIRQPDCALKVVEEVKRAISNSGVDLPVSVKTRIGSRLPEPEWWKTVAELEVAAVAMHGRTFKQLYSGEANWEILAEAAQVVRKSGALFLANGDIEKLSLVGGKLKAVLSKNREVNLDGFDGVLVGRAIIGNPWALRKDGFEPRIEEKLAVAVEHSKKFEELFPGDKFFAVRKHLAGYSRGFDRASELRSELMKTESADDVESVVKSFLANQ